MSKAPVDPEFSPPPAKPGKPSDLGGFIALASTIVLFVFPSSLSLGRAFDILGFALLCGIGFLFGLGAVRRGGPAGRLAGWLALIPLVLLFFLALVVRIVRWEETRAYWGF